ncbi:MAG: hypothetical protein AAF960_03620 [Bacteroidota bacterium]
MNIVSRNNTTEAKIIQLHECGNCWGHQEWQGQTTEKKTKRTDKWLDGFIIKFVKKYL